MSGLEINEAKTLFIEYANSKIAERSSRGLSPTELAVVHIVYEMVDKDFLIVLKNPLSDDYIADDMKNIFPSIFEKWKPKNDVTYEIYFVIKYFQYSNVKIVIMDMKSSLLVNIILLDFDNEVYSVCIPINIQSEFQSTSSQGISYTHDLSHIIKDKIVTPARCTILNMNGYPSNSLLGLPSILIFKILYYLNISEVLKLLATCKTLNALCNDSTVWKHLLERDYQTMSVDKSLSWKENYKKHYTTSLANRRFTFDVPEYISFCFLR